MFILRWNVDSILIDILIRAKFTLILDGNCFPSANIQRRISQQQLVFIFSKDFWLSLMQFDQLRFTIRNIPRKKYLLYF